MTKIRYNVVNSLNGREEEWTGVFLDEIQADKWYSRFGLLWERRGKTLIRRVVGDVIIEDDIAPDIN